MIVRISTEGQYRLPTVTPTASTDLDNEAVAAVEAGDEERFHEIFESMLSSGARRSARSSDGDVLSESDVILPPPDLTFAEAGEQFTGDGLIPD